MIEVKKEFSDLELLLFGPIFALFTGLIGWLILMGWFELYQTTYWLWAISALLIAVYYVVPAWRRPIFRTWLLSVFPMGWVVLHALLSILFYLLFTPMGLAMRLFGYDPMRRHLNPESQSYWIERPKARDPKDYLRQF